MATLQVKNVPDELRAALGQRAEESGTTMSELILRMLRRELSRPTVSAWSEGIKARHEAPRDIDTLGALDRVRTELHDGGR